MSDVRSRLRELVVADINQRYPNNADKAHAIVDRLLRMPQLESDESVIVFIDTYQRAIRERDARPIQ